MKRIVLYSLIIIALMLSIRLQAQQAIPNKLSTENTTVTREDENVTLSTTIKTENLHLRSQEMIYVTPVLYSADSTYFYSFDPIIIAGGTRYKVLQRNIKLNNIKFDQSPQSIIKDKKHKGQSIPLTMEAPYQEWMNNSRLVLHEDLTGCACKDEGKNTYLVMDPVLPAQYVPEFEITYIHPPKEEVKQRSETYAAHIDFEVGKYTISPNYKDNAEVLRKVDAIVHEIRNNSNLQVTGFQIIGYASPEGNAQSNMTLSQKRAEAFVLYLINTYKIIPSEIRADWKGEDWDGLREIVFASDIPDKYPVLDILDNESNVATRKAKLQQLSGGTTYRMMLRDYYPSLRKNEYTISFTVKNFDLSEAKEIMKTKPEYLSHSEMYMVAQSYPVNSEEYKEAFRTIEKFHPNDEVAIINYSAAALEHGDIESTISKLEKTDVPEAWNNMGIAYFEQTEYEKAGDYLRKAAQSGLPEGISNLNEYNKFMESIHTETP